MSKPLLHFYEQELAELRCLLGEFAKDYPKAGRQLGIEWHTCSDPDVEKMLEACAFMGAKVQRRLDDEFPQITGPLIETHCPHFLHPIPPATIFQLEIDPLGAGQGACIRIPRHFELDSLPHQGRSYQFRTCFDLELWPVCVKDAKLLAGQSTKWPDAAAVLTLEIEAFNSIDVASLSMDKFRFFLDGEAPLMNLVYELLFSNLYGVRISCGSCELILPSEAVKSVGFEKNESLLEEGTSPAYRLFSEYFAFYEKFMFFDLTGFSDQKEKIKGNRIEIAFLFSSFGNTKCHHRLLETLSASNFQLGCVPAINLFRRSGISAPTSHQKSHRVEIKEDPSGECEIYSLDSVSLTRHLDSSPTGLELKPFGACDPFSAEENGIYWHSDFRDTGMGDEGRNSLAVLLVDKDFKALRHDYPSVTFSLTCCNREMDFPFAPGENAFSIAEKKEIASVHLLRKPTPYLPPSANTDYCWRILSILSLRVVSPLESEDAALRRVLELCDFTGSHFAQKQIQGIAAVSSRVVTEMAFHEAPAILRGTEISITLDEGCYNGASLCLFVKLLKYWFEAQCSPNSFIKFRIFTRTS